MSFLREVQERAKERTRPDGEENLDCRLRCVSGKIFSKEKLDWVPCPLHGMGGVDPFSEKVLDRYVIPRAFRGKTLDVERFFTERKKYLEFYTEESVKELEEVLHRLVEFSEVTGSFDKVYFLNTQGFALDEYIYSYIQKALRMGKSVASLLPITKLSLMYIGSDPGLRDFHKKLSESGKVDPFDWEIYTENLEQQSKDLVEFYGASLADMIKADILFLEIPLSAGSSDLQFLEKMLVERWKQAGGKKGTVIVSTYGRYNVTFTGALLEFFTSLRGFGIPLVEVNLRQRDKVPGYGEEVDSDVVIEDVLEDFGK